MPAEGELGSKNQPFSLFLSIDLEICLRAAGRWNCERNHDDSEWEFVVGFVQMVGVKEQIVNKKIKKIEEINNEQRGLHFF